VEYKDAQTIVELSGLFHDVPDYKYVDPNEECRVIEKFLLGILEPWMVRVILDICQNVSFSTEIYGKLQDLGKFNILRNYVSDADKVSFQLASSNRAGRGPWNYRHKTMLYF
jgi:hypothetical protein